MIAELCHGVVEPRNVNCGEQMKYLEFPGNPVGGLAESASVYAEVAVDATGTLLVSISVECSHRSESYASRGSE